MFQLNAQSIFQFGSLVIYAVLISLVLCSKKVALKNLFITLLIAAAGISLAGLLTNFNLPYEQLVFWKLAVVLFSTWMLVAYVYFLAAYSQKNTGKVRKLGYAWLGVTLVVLALGYMVQGLNILGNNSLSAYYGYAINALVIVNDVAGVAILFYLYKLLKKATEAEEKNRAAYLLAGSLIMVVAGLLKYVVQEIPYAVAQAGYTINAIIVAYTLMRYRLLDIQVLMRKWVVYTGVTVCMTLAYLTLLLVLSNLLRLLPPQMGIPATIVLVVLFAYLFNWIKSALDKAADRLFYGSRYVNRQLLLSFAAKVSTFISIKEIANELMKPLAKTIRARQVAMLLPFNDYYSTKFVARLNEEDQIAPIMIASESLMIKWLISGGTAAFRRGDGKRAAL